ncbi:MFS transporter [Hydromonas duriensis]|uniref:Multidrug transporter MdfA n=1 Tax=Hydromonas duriensis TaxID=1527608 RepID=A0A4R6Y845_9BURK|nr:MFS transporter [Hydromonas duriensis]TDR31547.1 DHA1 family multidrug/chloramphenicol efflux transport protein-like MFS transporter [Hydromonas duriensis]
MTLITQLNRKTMLFPLALVIFEFCVYITNDLIQPAMLVITREFGVDATWNASAMSAFLFGGVIFQWLFGPLSDRVGRRRVLLSGVAFFITACLAMWWANDIYHFLFLRVLQGVALSFIGAVGHAVIQEAFEEKTAVQISALMANVAMMAPLVGPIVGSVFVNHWPWRWAFVIIASLASVSFVGLLRYMPETVKPSKHKMPIKKIAHDFGHLLAHRHFMLTSLSIPFMSIPLVSWIALAPTIIVSDYQLSSFAYGLLQMPIFAFLILSNFVLAHRTKVWRLGASVIYSYVFFVLGSIALVVAGFGWQTIGMLTAGICLFAFGEGISMSVLYRFAMTASDRPYGVTSALLGMMHMLGYALGVEVFKWAYFSWGVAGFVACSVMSVVLYVILSRVATLYAMQVRAEIA